MEIGGQTQARRYWDSCCRVRKWNKQQVPSLAPWEHSELGLEMGGGHRQDQVQGSGWRVDWWFAHTLVVLCAGHMGSTLVLLQTPQKWQLGFWPLCILFVNCHSYFLVPYSFFVSVAGGDVCSDAGIAAKGPRSQPISLRYVMYLAMENGSGGKWVYLSSGRIILKHRLSYPVLTCPASNSFTLEL